MRASGPRRDVGLAVWPMTRLSGARDLLEECASTRGQHGSTDALPDSAHPVQRLAAPRRREQTMRVMIEQLLGLASRNPLLLVVEDAHWIDPATHP